MSTFIPVKEATLVDILGNDRNVGIDEEDPVDAALAPMPLPATLTLLN